MSTATIRGFILGRTGKQLAISAGATGLGLVSGIGDFTAYGLVEHAFADGDGVTIVIPNAHVADFGSLILGKADTVKYFDGHMMISADATGCSVSIAGGPVPLFVSGPWSAWMKPVVTIPSAA